MKLERVQAPAQPQTPGVFTRTSKEWSWSYSKLKNFETCPKKMYEVDILKNHQEDTSDPNSPLAWGNRGVHESFKIALQRAGTELLPEMAQYKYWLDRVRRGTGKLAGRTEV